MTRGTVPYSAQIDSGSERGMRWYMWYSSVIGQFPKHVRDIRVFISMQNSTLYDGIKGGLKGVWLAIRQSHKSYMSTAIDMAYNSKYDKNINIRTTCNYE